MQRPLILAALMAGGVIAIAAEQPRAGRVGPPSFAPVTTIEKIADNLYRIPDGGGASAVWVRSDGVLLVDTKVAGNGQALLDQIKKVTDKPITHIINTHAHGDHTGSNSFFPARVEIVTQDNTRDNMLKMPDFQTEAGKVGLPDRTFKDRMTLFSGKDAVDLYYFGPAHTNGDAFVVFRSARVMHAGDLFASKGVPFIDTKNGGSGIAYPDTIAKAVAGIKNVDKVITGHGSVMNWQEFADYGEFNRLFLNAARAALAAGKSADQAAMEFKLPAKFSDYQLAGDMTDPAGNFSILFDELKSSGK